METITTNCKYVLSWCNDLNILKIRFVEDEEELKILIYNVISRELRHFGVNADDVPNIIGKYPDFFDNEAKIYHKSRLYSIELVGDGNNYEIYASPLNNKQDTGSYKFVLKYELIPESDLTI